MTAEVSKLNAYAVLTGVAAQVSKLNAYAVLSPAPIGITLAATESRDTAHFVSANRAQLAVTEARDTAVFHVTAPIGIALAATESRDIAAFPSVVAQTRVMVMA